jgi:NAD+ synthase (glutamine-hydrolysing)
MAGALSYAEAMQLIKVAAAALNQTPLDWDGNKANILGAMAEARRQAVSLLCLPEMCITGYGCEDAFQSPGVQQMAWRVLEEIAPATQGMIVSVGLPVMHNNALFNAACLLVDGGIAGFVAKRFLAGDGIHYEPRWFKPWPCGERAELRHMVAREKGSGVDFVASTYAGAPPDPEATKSTPDPVTVTYPLGDIFFDVGGVRIGFEICEDAWVAQRPGSELFFHGVDVILNPSASHFAFGKTEVRHRFVLEGSRAFSATYIYSNLLGNEAGRAIYDGDAMIATGGKLVACGPRFSYAPWQVTAAVIDLDLTRMQRARLASTRPVVESHAAACVEVPFEFPTASPQVAAPQIAPWERGQRLKEEEFARAVPLALFDYLRKSRSQGFVVSISGGADSATVATMVALAVEFAVQELGLPGVKQKLGHIERLKEAKSVSQLVRSLLSCVYQSTRNSSQTTREASRSVAEAIGAEFLEFDVDSLVQDYVRVVSGALGRKLDWKTDDVALQNIQARTRAPSVWLLANVRNALLLSTSNRSEAAVGYTTMDGDTSGSISPVAGIDKAFLRHWLRWMEQEGPHGLHPIPALAAVNRLPPTAELRPQEAKQTDEDDLMPYEILDAIERGAIRDKQTPLEVFQLLWPRYPQHTAEQFALWVERFFQLWCRNQWKRERYAPSFHLDDENLDPKTWCRFPILSGGYRRELAELREYVKGL